MLRNDLIPEVYKTRRPLHDDWGIWPFTRIPRAWTFFGLPMPPTICAGTSSPSNIPIQRNYPLAPDAILWSDPNSGELQVMSAHPVPPPGQWHILSVYIPRLGRIPCFIATSIRFGAYRLHLNLGLKPDVTLGDWIWWFPEASFTIKRILEPGANPNNTIPQETHMNIFARIKEALIGRVLEKGIKQVIQALIARVMALQLDQFGITIDPNLATLALHGLIEMLRVKLKEKGFKLP